MWNELCETTELVNPELELEIVQMDIAQVMGLLEKAKLSQQKAIKLLSVMKATDAEPQAMYKVERVISNMGFHIGIMLDTYEDQIILMQQLQLRKELNND